VGRRRRSQTQSKSQREERRDKWKDWQNVISEVIAYDPLSFRKGGKKLLINNK